MAHSKSVGLQLHLLAFGAAGAAAGFGASGAGAGAAAAGLLAADVDEELVLW
jgi:hypothetical protein